jgi:hypothetical protein
MEYANKNVEGRATAGLTTGIIGTALGVLNGGLGGIMGGLGGCNNGWNNGCHENMPVNRYELGLQQEIASKDSQIALRDANIYGDQKLLEVYKYFDGELKDIRNTLCAQAVTNQKTADSFALASADLAAVRSNLEGQIRMESERRCCGDNAIVTYANATFYPKLVADVTAGTTTTAQVLYNPIPDCGCCCK